MSPAWSVAALVLAFALPLGAQQEPAAEAPPAVAPAHDTEAIYDPEVDGPRPPAQTTPESERSSARASASPSVELEPFTASSAPPPTELRAVLASRIGVDLQWTIPREDVIEATQIGQLEMVHHPSDDVGIALGMRVRHVSAFRETDDEGGGRDRHGLDIAPVSAYVDLGVAPSAHLRAGYQIVEMGRFDVFSASNFLAIYDLRSGPATMPEANHLAQPALRLDVEPDEHWTITGVYVPFFSPHLVDMSGTDYSLLASVEQGEPPSDATADTEAARVALEDALGRSGPVQASGNALRAFGPDPDLLEPQGAVRVTLHGASGEMALTLGTAMEKLPVVTFSDEFLTYVQTMMAAPGATITDLLEPAPVALHYGRYYVASIDAATDLGPVQVGAEVAFMKDRTLLAGERGQISEAGTTDFLHGGLRAELLEGEDFVVALEGFTEYALQPPDDPDRRWLGLADGRYWFGTAVGLQWTFADDFTFEAAGAVLNGPTEVAVPRIVWEATEGVYIELGVVLLEGASKPRGSPDASAGSLYTSVDQAFTGIRWVP